MGESPSDTHEHGSIDSQSTNAEQKLEQLQAATDLIVAAAEAEIERHYADKPYHNVAHTRFVASEAMALADALEKDPNQAFSFGRYAFGFKERCLLKLAAAAHDVVYEKNPREGNYVGENEEASAHWIETKMREHREVFNAQDIHIAQAAVLATWARIHKMQVHPLTSDGSGISPSLEEATIIQQNMRARGAWPEHIIAQLLCDADLAALGSPWKIYRESMLNYYLELHPDGGQRRDVEEYLTLQYRLLEDRHYFTKAAYDRYDANLRTNKEKLETVLIKEDGIDKVHRLILKRIETRNGST